MENIKPMHPGLLLATMLDDAHMTSLEFAREMGLSGYTVYRLTEGTARVTPKIADRIRDFAGGDAKRWLEMQKKYDEWMTKHS